MNKLLTAIVLLAFQLPTLAQDFKTLIGIVLDEETAEPLEFATVHLKQSAKGTVTYRKGEFEFHIPTSALNDQFIISFIGYDNYVEPLSNTNFSAKQTFELTPTSLLLSEVVVETDSLTAKEIVEKAVEKIKENYPGEPIVMEAFFREIEWENDKSVQVTEAALQIYDKKYNQKRASFQEVINTQAVRRSISYRQIKGFNNLGSAIVDVMENNDVRFQHGMLNTKKNEYVLDSITFYNNRPVYIISMSNKLDRGTLLIDLQTLAFIKIGLERRKRFSDDPYYFKWDYQDSLKLGRVMFKFSVEFREIESKMYPSYMMKEELAHIYDPLTKEVSIEKRERLEMMINDIT